MSNMRYSNEQIGEFVQLAQEIGITRAKRELGFPHSWATGRKWCEAAGIEVPIDEIKSQAAEHYDWYKTEELLVVAQMGIQRTYEELAGSKLTPDEHKKMAEAFQKYTNTWLLLQGKANNITESRKTDSADLEIMDLINEEKARNALIEQGEDESVDTDN